MSHYVIKDIIGREILDSRGNPTVEAEVILMNDITGKGIAPSGASTGVYEALELRDQDSGRFLGKGVLQAVANINTVIRNALLGKDVTNIYEIDAIMIATDGTKDKSNLGANAILAVSIACIRAAANALHLPLFRFLGGMQAATLPIPMMNIINGGAHAKNSLDFQEFMIMPVGAANFKEALRMGTEVYHHLKKVLENKGLQTAVGDEGGFAPDTDSIEAVLELLIEAVSKAGYTCGKDIYFALDVAASEWKPEDASSFMDAERKITGQFTYHLPKTKKDFCTDELIDMYKNLIQKYPIISIEDPLDEEDWMGWEKITKELGHKIQLVGDDLFVTNTSRLSDGIQKRCGNSILIKPNQIGTISESIHAIKMAHNAGYTAIASHRSGETEDSTIADLAVALSTCQIKTGAPCRSERVAKYNQLLRIEEACGNHSQYPGLQAFNHFSHC